MYFTLFSSLKTLTFDTILEIFSSGVKKLTFFRYASIYKYLFISAALSTKLCLVGIFMKSQQKYSLVINTSGLKCPLPLLKVQKNIKSLRKGSEALIIADDPMAEIDLKHFCLNNNYILTEVKNEQDGGRQFFSLKKDQ